MTPFFEHEYATLYHGKCELIMPALPESSIDAVVTDPPYELGFMGSGWDQTGIAYNPEMWRSCLRLLKPGGHLLAFGGARTYHRMASAVEDAGFEIRDQIMWLYGSGFPKSKNLEGGHKGWGTALKPAHEPIIVARKPFRGGVAANVAEHGTGAINIDACRIPVEDQEYARNCSGDRGHEHNRTRQMTAFTMTAGKANNGGRWPANVIHDGSDEVLEAFSRFGDDKGAAAPVTVRNGDKFRNTYGAFAGDVDEQGSTFQGDTGSAARFYYCAKADRHERNEGCEQIPEGPLHWSSGSQSPGTFQATGTHKAAHNNHPTVKPTALMRYLCRLVTPPGGVVLDHFMGSGSTYKAAHAEGFRFIGIEQKLAYCEITRSRITQEVLRFDAVQP